MAKYPWVMNVIMGGDGGWFSRIHTSRDVGMVTFHWSRTSMKSPEAVAPLGPPDSTRPAEEATGWARSGSAGLFGSAKASMVTMLARLRPPRVHFPSATLNGTAGSDAAGNFIAYQSSMSPSSRKAVMVSPDCQLSFFKVERVVGF